MNFLAHLTLSAHDPDEMVGNLLGDFTKYVKSDTLPAPMRRGVDIHRSIDRFTDFHFIVSTSKGRVAEERWRFAGVLVDVFYDHFLARDFAAHTGRDLREFVAQVYAALRARRQAFPEFVGTVMERMIEQDWLGCYATVDGIGLTLERIAGRLSRPTNLPAGIADLRAAYDALDADFRQFWPCVVEHVKAERAKFVVRPDGTPG